MTSSGQFIPMPRTESVMSSQSWDRSLMRLVGQEGDTEDVAYMAVPGRWAIVVQDPKSKPVKVVASFALADAAEEFARHNYRHYCIVPSAAVIPSRAE